MNELIKWIWDLNDLNDFYDFYDFNDFELTIHVNLRFIIKNNSEDK